jgi:DNA-binding MarR family transcriptional regulator
MSRHEVPRSLGHLLGEICRLQHGRVHALLGGLGVYRGQPPALRALWAQEGLTHSELAHLLHVKPPTITHMIQRMERAGFVQRRPDPTDERVSRVYLTDAGRAIQDEIQRVFRELEAEVFAGFAPEEQVLLRGLLLRVRENLMRGDGAE